MSDDQPSQESALKYRYQFFQSVTTTIGTACRWGGAAVIVYYLYKSVEAVAGRVTVANVDIALDPFATRWPVRVCLALGALGVIGSLYGWRERRLRRTTIERLQRRNQTLEKLIDPNRTSSELTPRGDTRPEDKI